MKKYIKSNLKALFFTVLFSILYAVSFYFLTREIGKVVDAASNSNLTVVKNSSFLGSVFVCVWVITGYIVFVFTSDFHNGMTLSINRDFCNSLLGMPISLFDEKPKEYYMNLLTEDLNILRTKYVMSIPLFIIYFIQVIVFLGGLFLINPYLCVLSVFFSFIPLYLSRFLSERLQSVQMDVSKSNEKNFNSMKELVFGSQPIKQSRNGQSFILRYLDVLKDNLAVKKRAFVQINSANKMMRAIGIISNLVVLILGAFLIIQGKVTPGDLIMSMFFITSVSDAVGNAVESLNDMKSTKSIREKFLEMFNKNETVPKGHALMTNEENLSQGISIENFGFSFGEHRIFSNFSYQFKNGGVYAVIGESGSGKSTLARILTKSLTGYEGNVSVYGQNLENISEDSLFDSVAIVSQESVIFKDTIFNNITMFDKRFQENDKRYQDLIKKLRLEKLIKKEKEGTLDITQLSGGEKERISIARALLRNARILILDEPTTGLDPEIAKEVKDMIMSLDGILRIVITHDYDPQTLDKFDGVICMNQVCL